MHNISKLIETLEQAPKSKEISKFIRLAENESSVDITNQPELTRGNLKLSVLNKMHQYLSKKTDIKKIYFCPHDNFNNCDCRKPKPGMILDAIRDYNIDIKKSYLVGDRKNDIDAANQIKLKSFFIDRKYDEQKPKRYIRKVKNLYEVLNFIKF